jgi:hypothetical protein
MQKPPDGKIVAQVLYASRLHRDMAKQDYLAEFYARFDAAEIEKCDQGHKDYSENSCE